MNRIGIELGTSTVKLARVENGGVAETWSAAHHGKVAETLLKGLRSISLPEEFIAGATGCNAFLLRGTPGESAVYHEIPAITEGVRFLVPNAGCIIEIGSQNSRFITELDKKAPRFSVNEHCAGGTGSFFEDQMSRLGLRMEEYSKLVSEARSIPRLSGRCAVFAKTDIIHRQQEGVSTPDILLGLCYAMIRNYRAVIVRDLPVNSPVVFCGGVTQNAGVRRAIPDVFGLAENDFIVPEHANFAAAVGAAVISNAVLSRDALLDAVGSAKSDGRGSSKSTIPPLVRFSGFEGKDPSVTGVIPADGCALGIDIGSTSTDLVLIDRNGTLIDFQYLRTAGDPEKAVRKGLASIRERFGEPRFLSVGITGSGRERLGRMMGADVIRDEITAQARAAVRLVPAADTVFEIGGQDSKFISLRDGEVSDFQMNRICAAGTGSFIEEQAARMGIPLDRFGPLALESTAPADLGERCTVFIETAMASAAAEGAGDADLAAGLCCSIVRNYLHKVVGSKPVGQHIVLQGGVAYNPGIVAAFAQIYGNRLSVSPYFSVSGAYGAALLSLESVENRPSTFKGFDFPGADSDAHPGSRDVQRNTSLYNRPGQLLLAGYDGTVDPRKKTVGIPFVLLIHKFFPMANAFFKSLGFNVLLSDPTTEETIRLSQQAARSETCYPVKLIYGHMLQLIEKNVDYIFLPSIRTMKHLTSKADNNYGCVYMQTAPRSIAKILRFEEKGIKLLSPVFDLDFGKEAMATAMLSVGKELGIAKPFCVKALLAGAAAVRRHGELVEKQGQALLASLKPEDKVLVLITRNYGISDPVLNMGIPQLLLERGYKVITLSHLPAHDLDISPSYPNLYWPFGQHIISGIKMVARHPNLYAVYLTNHGCGPDSMLSHMVRQEMGDKPYLQIEVDEHFSKVGVVTRVEAFLNSLSHRPSRALPADFNIADVPLPRADISARPDKSLPLYLPDLGLYTPYLRHYLTRAFNADVHLMNSIDPCHLEFGRSGTSAKEYLPFTALLDSVLRAAGQNSEAFQVLIPFTEGSEADGQYAQGIRAVLDRKGLTRVHIVSPVLEQLPSRAQDFDLLLRAVLTGDLLYAAPPEKRVALAPDNIPSWDGLLALAESAKGTSAGQKVIGAVGTPMCMTVLDNGILSVLEKEGNHLLRAPLSEYLLFLWNDAAASKGTDAQLKACRENMTRLSEVFGADSPFAADMSSLIASADIELPRFAGGNGRYRWAKAIELSHRCDAVLALAPRYENTAAVMDMRGLAAACDKPLFRLDLDGDWDVSAWSRLRSFLYYC